MKKFFMLALTASMFLVGCNMNRSKVEKLEAMNDSLVQVSTQKQAEFDELLVTLNGVEEGLQKIKDAENFLTVQANSGSDINKTTRERLEDDLTLIEETMKQNREKLAKLEALSKSSSIKSKELQNTIARLTREVDEKANTITLLKAELSRKDAHIASLSKSLESLQGEMSELSKKAKDQELTLAMNDEKMNRAYYAFGTKKELKDEKILEGGTIFKSKKVLETDFNAAYFTPVDVRNFSRLPLFAKKAQVLSNMPEDSYDFVEDEYGNLILVITDTERFWSLSRYLVVQVS